MIAIIDYGMGNLRSVEKGFAKVGQSCVVTSDSAVIAAADKVVLPGVGAFGDCMNNLHSYGLVDVIHQVIRDGKPFLGICLGLQLLFDSSDESPDVPGLGIFAGRCRKLTGKLKVPQIGWNSLQFVNNHPLLTGIPEQSYVYFVHSYAAVPQDEQLVLAQTDYGGPVTAMVSRDNVVAAQFHPEKSSTVGLRMLQNFGEMKSC